MDVLVMTGQLLLSLSILVILHELGHFLPAKWFGAKVEKFYLFFDPWFEIFKFKRGETEYGIGWLPLGGYVKIAGMMDESFDTEQMESEPQPWEFRSKPAWQRLIIMVGGVLVNFILGVLIYSMVTWTYGTEFLPTQNAKYGIVTDSLGQAMGLRDGDIPIAVGNKELDKLSAGLTKIEIIINGARTIKVKRNGQTETLPISDEIAASLSKYENSKASLYGPRFPFVVTESFPSPSPAKEAGIQPGDKIIALNGVETPFFHDFTKNILGGNIKPEQEVTVTLERGVDTLNFTFNTSKQGLIGAGVVLLETQTQSFSLAESFPVGWDRSIGFLGTQIKAFGKMFSGEIKAKDSLGSFFTIGKQFGGMWIWQRFWELTAALSLILGFINILPIPMLDGGHVMFLLYEMISGRKPNEKFQEYVSYVGLALLMGLMVYALGLDIWRNFF